MPILGSFSPTFTHAQPDNLSPPPTRLYFHAASSTVSGTLPTTEQSSLTSNKDVDAQTVNRSMSTTIGSSVATLTLTSNGTTSAQNYYFSKFISAPINQTSIAANTWTYAFATRESGATANFPVSGSGQVVYINVYVWRPSNGTKVGTILDGNTAPNVREGTANQQMYRLVNFAGSSVGSVSNGDVIVCEIWFQVTQGSTNVLTDEWFYDGGTVYDNENTAASDAASYLETPEVLNIAAGQNITKSLSETIAVSESLTRIAGKIRTRSETVTISESLTRIKGSNRAISQTVTVSDAVVRVKGIVRAISQTIGISETVARLAGKIRALSQTVAISESLTRIKSAFRSLTNSITAVDSTPTFQKGKVRTLSDTIAVSDSLARMLGQIRALSQTVAVSESLTRIKSTFRSLSETVTVSDSAVGLKIRAVLKSLSETVAVSDAVARMAGKIRTVSQTVGVSDALTRLAAKSRSLAETVAVSDAVTRTKGIVRPLAQTVTIGAGVATFVRGKVRTIAQTIAVSDTLARLSAKKRAISETIAVSDSVTRALKAKNVTKTISETAIAVSDALAKLKGHIFPSAAGGVVTRAVRRSLRARPPKSLQEQLYPPILRDFEQRPEIRPVKNITRALPQQSVHVSDIATCIVTRGPESQARFLATVASASTQLRQQLEKQQEISRLQAKHISKSLREKVTVIDYAHQTRTQDPERLAREKIAEASQRVIRSASAVKTMLQDRSLSKVNKLKALLRLLKLDEVISDE